MNVGGCLPIQGELKSFDIRVKHIVYFSQYHEYSVICAEGDVSNIQGRAAPIKIHLPPSKHEVLFRCWFYVGPASETVGQH